MRSRAREIIPDKRKVVGLIEQAHEGKVCLPKSQRDFVWTREEVADLVRSIIRGYLIGSLPLLRRGPHNPPFAPEFLRGSNPQARNVKPERLVLDGQQRLSSFIAPDLSLQGSSRRRWFFVDLDHPLGWPGSDGFVLGRAKGAKRLARLAMPVVARSVASNQVKNRRARDDRRPR